MPLPSLPFELHPLIIFFVGFHPATLYALCRVNSDFRDLALPQLYAKVVFRSHAQIEAFLSCGGDDDETESGAKGSAQKREGRRMSELRLIKTIELHLPVGCLPETPIAIPPYLLKSAPIHIDILRINRSGDKIQYISAFLQILSPLRLISGVYHAEYTLPFLSITPDRPIVIDCYGAFAPVLPLLDRTCFRSVIWSAVITPRTVAEGLLRHSEDILSLAQQVRQLHLVAPDRRSVDYDRQMLQSLREAGDLDGCDVEVSSRYGERMYWGETGTVWNDRVVEHLVPAHDT